MDREYRYGTPLTADLYPTDYLPRMHEYLRRATDKGDRAIIACEIATYVRIAHNNVRASDGGLAEAMAWAEESGQPRARMHVARRLAMFKIIEFRQNLAALITVTRKTLEPIINTMLDGASETNDFEACVAAFTVCADYDLTAAHALAACRKPVNPISVVDEGLETAATRADRMMVLIEDTELMLDPHLMDDLQRVSKLLRTMANYGFAARRYDTAPPPIVV